MSPAILTLSPKQICLSAVPSIPANKRFDEMNKSGGNFFSKKNQNSGYFINKVPAQMHTQSTEAGVKAA